MSKMGIKRFFSISKGRSKLPAHQQPRPHPRGQQMKRIAETNFGLIWNSAHFVLLEYFRKPGQRGLAEWRLGQILNHCTSGHLIVGG